MRAWIVGATIALTLNIMTDIALTIMTAIDKIEAGTSSWVSYGLRIDPEAYDVGDVLPCSRVWDDNNPTDDKLDGTCVIGIGNSDTMGRISDEDDLHRIGLALAAAKIYSGTMYLVASKRSAGRGEDHMEEVLVNPEVIMVIG